MTLSILSNSTSNKISTMAALKKSSTPSNEIEMKGHARRDLERETSQSYRLEQVVADLVDNCIDANAEHVEVVFNKEKFGKKDSHYIIVLDDGQGMEGDQISTIMDFGAERTYDELDLGKFGVGLKSSSLSHAKEITVLSKTNGGKIELRRLSHQIVYQRDKWVLLSKLKPSMETDAIELAKNLLKERFSGTAVVLEDMHKIDLQVGHESNKKEYLNSEYGIIREYLSLVFEHYLSGVTLERKNGTQVERKVKISFNGKKNLLKPLDPFCREQEDGSCVGTLKLKDVVSVASDGVVVKVPVVIWITPNQNNRPIGYDKRLTTASRDLGIRELQGLYFYRNGRLIDFAGWKKIRKVEEHNTCHRWEVHFSAINDNFFQLDPSKREIQIPRSLVEKFQKLAANRIRWHQDDEKSLGCANRARERHSGKDEVPKEQKQPIAKKPKQGKLFTKESPQAIYPVSDPEKVHASKARASSAQALKKIRINEFSGSKLGKLIVTEAQKGDTWEVVLNSNHAMYEEFIKVISSRK